MQGGDFEDTVPVQMAGFLALHCGNCGAMHSPEDAAVNVEDGLGWQCPSCGAVNFEDGPASGVSDEQREFLNELDALGGADYLEEPFDGPDEADVEETFDEEDQFICDWCGAVATDGDELSAGMQEGPDETIIWSCPTCGHWNDYVS